MHFLLSLVYCLYRFGSLTTLLEDVPMPKLSRARLQFPRLNGLELVNQGKVRDTYALPNEPDLLLSNASDGLSAFDFVLNTSVPGKGKILNAMNHFWSVFLQGHGIQTDLLTTGSGIDRFLPEHLRNNPDLQARATVVRRLKMAPVEFIARAMLTGTGLKSYQEAGHVCGHQLAPGLQDGDQLPEVLATPTTKAEEGHDEHISAADILDKYPEQTSTLIRAFKVADEYARSRGIVIGDTKLEFGVCGTLGDEKFTPDSSRFWEERVWRAGRLLQTGRKAPPPFDKQLIREWCIQQKIHLLDPKIQAQVERVQSLEVPPELVTLTVQTYRYIFWRLTGQTLEQYARDCMEISVPRERKKIVVLCGSESDLPMVEPVIKEIRPSTAQIAVHVISCHRNPGELDEYAGDLAHGVEIVADAYICAGGMAFALPGVFDAFAKRHGRLLPIIGVALGKDTQLEAAKLSISELPGAPVIMDENDGVYVGSKGLRDAVNRVIHGELPPRKPAQSKPVRFNALANFEVD